MTTPIPSRMLPAPNTPPIAPDLWQKRLLTAARWIGLLLLFYLLGPVVMLAKITQEEAAYQMWRAQERWAQVSGSGIASLLCYVPIVLFHGPLATFWATSFVALAQGLHLPALVWLADTSLWPPVPSSTLLRWFLAYPLSGLLALFIEAVQPRTVWETKRVLTTEEQQTVKAIAQEQRRLKAAQQANIAAQKTTAAARKPRKPRASTRPQQKQPAPPPPSNSLWGRINWSAVPETHPLKAAVREEVARRAAPPQEEERHRLMAEQQAARTHYPSSPQIIDAMPAHPTPRSASLLEEEAPAYNWDEGEGRVQA